MPAKRDTAMTNTPKATDLLNKAASHMADRAATYDKPDGERSMGRAVQAFNAITGRDLSEPEGWLLMQVLKDVRLFQRAGYHADSAEDCIAYAALKAEAKARDGVVVAHEVAPAAAKAEPAKLDYTSNGLYGLCSACKHREREAYQEPCDSCMLADGNEYPNWEPAEDKE